MPFGAFAASAPDWGAPFGSPPMTKASQAYLSHSRPPAGQSASLDALIPMVRRIAGHMATRLPPSVEIDDLIQAGCLGLAQARERFDPSQGASFETFASARARGAMLDWLRAEDQLPKRSRSEARAAERAISQLRHALGREPREEEIAERLGMALDDYQALGALVDGAHLLRFEDLTPEGPEALLGSEPDENPLSQLMRSESAKALARLIDALPERERLILSLHHEQELTFKEIGLVLELSEARVSQLHAHAMARARSLVAEHLRE